MLMVSMWLLTATLESHPGRRIPGTRKKARAGCRNSPQIFAVRSGTPFALGVTDGDLSMKNILIAFVVAAILGYVVLALLR